MARVSRQRLEHLVDILAELQGRPTGRVWIQEDGKNKARIGHLKLDHNTMYGGWDLVEILTESGGEESLIGNTFAGRGRLKAHEMETWLIGALWALEFNAASREKWSK